jgi:transposase
MKREKGQRRDLKAMKKRRLRAAGMFAAGKSQAYVVERLGVSRQSASRWHSEWRKGGRQGLVGAERAGRKPKVESTQLKEVERALLRGPIAHGYSTNLWTLARLSVVIEKLTGVRYHRGHVWKLMDKLGWSLQRPAKRAKERNRKAVAQWIAGVWPRLKKSAAPARLDPLPRRKRSLPAPLRPRDVGADRGNASPDSLLQLEEAVDLCGAWSSMGLQAESAILPDPTWQL